MPRITPFKSRFFWKIYSTYSVLFLGIIACIGGFAYIQLETSLENRIFEDLNQKLGLVQPQVMSWLSHGISPDLNTIKKMGKDSGTRLTLIGKTGKVIADSHMPPGSMDNHHERPEIKMARLTGKGYTMRYSQSLGQNMYYLARSFGSNKSSEAILRVSSPASLFLAELEEVQFMILLLILLALAASLSIGFLLARSVAIPIMDIQNVCQEMMKGSYDVKVHHLPDDEIGQLGVTLNALGSEITKKMDTITADKIKLRKLERVRRDFVANVSHEIKTPLTAIKGYAETLLAGPLDGDPIVRRFLEKIDNNAQRLALLVQDILSLARLESPEQTVITQSTDWQTIIEGAAQRFEDHFKEKGLQLELKLSPDVKVEGEYSGMTEVLDNLISNAIRYTPEGGIITVSTSVEADKGILEVKDTGIGIAPEQQNRIFERFYRVDKARSRILGGTGLGLSIVKHTLSVMKGDISLTSATGKGSCFRVSLPIAH